MSADSLGDDFASGSVHTSPLLDDLELQRLERQAPALSRAADDFKDLSAALPRDCSVDANDALAIVKGVEDAQRRLVYVKLVALRALLDQADPHAFGVRTQAGVLVRELSVTRHEARKLVSLAGELTAGVGLSGAAVGPRFPELAAGLRDGGLSLDQVEGMLRELGRLPRRLRGEHESAMERLLAQYGKEVDVEDLRVLGKRCLDWIDPDGRLDIEQPSQEDLYVSVRQRDDGYWRLSGLLSPEVGLALSAVLTDRGAAATAAAAAAAAGEGAATVPVTAMAREAAGSAEADTVNAAFTADGMRAALALPVDPRPDGARRHDRFAQVVTRGAQTAPGGAGFALVVTATAEQMAAGRGEIEAAGGHCRLQDVLSMSPGGQFYYMAHRDDTRAMEVRTANRFANAKQMTILKARDRGCSFPGCDMPVGWTEAHHMVPWSEGGSTHINNLTLVCSFHHRWHDQHGWRAELIDGVPAWIPPKNVDRDQVPVYHSRFIAQRVDLAGLDEPRPSFNLKDLKETLAHEECTFDPTSWPLGESQAEPVDDSRDAVEEDIPPFTESSSTPWPSWTQEPDVPPF